MILLPIVCSLSPVTAGARSGRTVELVTLEPGDVVWSLFGHIGIRIVDEDGRGDMFYDYGHARVKDWTFVVDYLQGDCRFYLAERPWREVVSKYRDDDRTIIRQRMNLTPEQEKLLITRLRWEARPENREYVYDQLLDNCSTRLRDLLDDVTGGALLRADEAYVPGPRYRDFLLEYTSGSLLWQLVLDMLIGPNHDREAGRWEHMYLPLNLRWTAERAATVIDGAAVPLVSAPVIEYEREGPPTYKGRRNLGRYLALSICAGIGLLVGMHRRLARGLPSRLRNIPRHAAALALILVGVVFAAAGALILFCVMTSTVPDYRWNHNVFVFVPSDLVFVVTGVRWLVRNCPRTGPIVYIYLIARLAVLASVAVLKIAGILSIQDNWIFMACSAAVLAGILWGLPRRQGELDMMQGRI